MKHHERTIHPTQKPVALISTLIQWITNPGDIVLDPFCGSGTTAIACKELNRNYICIEKELEYYQIACNRINQPIQQDVSNSTENLSTNTSPYQLTLF